MFAVLKTGGKQYRVQAGDVLRVEKLRAEAGEAVQFNEVLVAGDRIGTPLVDGAAVQATVIDQIKGEKVIHFVRRRRKHSSKRTKGHRQQLTLLRVTDILLEGAGATGVKAAVGAAFREPQPGGVRGALSRTAAALGSAVGTVERAAQPVVERVAPAVERVEGVAQTAFGRVEHAAEAVAERVEDAVEEVVERVEDAASTTAGKVALGVAAAVGAVAAAAVAGVVLGGQAKADDTDDAKGDDAQAKE